jgi:hypothetical protein
VKDYSCDTVVRCREYAEDGNEFITLYAFFGAALGTAFFKRKDVWR